MRIKRLDLTRYGKFTDRVIDFGPAPASGPDFHIVYGLNEAGKSTAFSAYLDLLFGIPERSPYNFLHAYSAMQIGGTLEIDGRDHALLRLKQRLNALTDERGNPVNEALIAAALGGLSRETYRTMFSLDDQSLKEGGAAIVESKGDLGELLFSASAGLADVSKTLVAIAQEAEALHKKRGRNTALAQFKQHLASLKEQRSAIDVQASAFAQLVAGQAQAEKAFSEAEAELSQARTRLMQLQRVLRALPLSRQVERLRASLSEKAGLPRPAKDLASMLPHITRNETRLDTAMRGIDQRLERLRHEAGMIEPDRRLLELSPRIGALQDLRARHRTAETDLPRRRTALAEQAAALKLALKALGQEDHPEPAALILPATLIGALRDLIERKSGIDAGLKTASREMQRIEAAMEEARAELDAPEAQAAETADAQRLATITDQLQRSEKPAQLSVETRQAARLKQAVDQKLAELAPFSGGIDGLRAMTPPDRRQFEAWRSSAIDIARRSQSHQERMRTLETERQAAETRLSLLTGGAEAFDDAAASAARQERDRLWLAHRESLDRDSAARFEDALRRDDRLVETRLSRSGDLAEIRQVTLALRMGETALERERALAAEAEAELSTLVRDIASATPAELRTPGEPAEAQIARLQGWMERRNECLAAHHDLEEAQDRMRALREEIDASVAMLRTALKRTGLSPDARMPVESLFEEAQTHVARCERQAARRQAAERRLADLKAQAAERRRDFSDAEEEAAGWTRAWTAALAKTWFGTEASPVDVRALLDALATLPALIGEREQLAQRIESMEGDRRDFTQAVLAILDELGLDGDAAAIRQADDELLKRHAEALRLADQLSDKTEEIVTLERERADLAREQAEHQSARRRILDALEAEDLDQAAIRLEQIQERDQVEARIGECTEQMMAEMGVTSQAEALAQLQGIEEADASGEAAALSDKIELLTSRTRDLYADLTQARGKLDAVGGDGAVAALEAERATVLLDMEELARRYLRLKTGALAAGSALELYRERHRSSMMRRASDAFRQITRGEYSGLTARPEKDRETLIGIPKEGGSRLTEAMSTGTKYQLYLALRLAGYEEFAEVRPPVPFIADDIMETFDEPRSEEVFRLFGEMAGIGQVIYLTHHRHLCDLATSVVPGVRIHQL